MSKQYKYKVGDTVTITNKFPANAGWGTKCIIMEIYRNNSNLDYSVKDIDSHWRYLVYEFEIEPTIHQGEQLLLFEL